MKYRKRCSVKEILQNGKILWKHRRKSSFSKVAGSKKGIHWQVFFIDFAKSLSIYDFREDYFREPKLLLAPNMLIYLNTSTNRCIINLRPLAPGILGHHALHRINTSGIQIRRVLKNNFFHKVENLKSWCYEKNYCH